MRISRLHARSGLSKKKRPALVGENLKKLELSGPSMNRMEMFLKVESRHLVGSVRSDHRGGAIRTQGLKQAAQTRSRVRSSKQRRQRMQIGLEVRLHHVPEERRLRKCGRKCKTGESDDPQAVSVLEIFSKLFIFAL
jgi:hypothetical protein